IGARIPPETRLESTFALSEPTWTAEALVAMALEKNPDLGAVRASASAARTGVRAARTQYLPSLSASVDFNGSAYSAGNLDPLYAQALGQTAGAFESCVQQNRIRALLGDAPENCAPFNVDDPAVADAVRQGVRASNPSFPFGVSAQPMTARLSISLPIFNGMARERRIEEARVAAQDAELAVRSRELQLATDIEGLLLALRTAYRTAQLQEQVVARATEELRLAQERFRFGVASSVEVTDAQTSLSEAERARIDAIYNYHKSLAALEALVGQPLR
ncbi:MAG TPA: TolC family protein, partial [Longimicrobiaceae bacterium]|nr:TolC family protein [Longimicrobiaceae bacterium]